MSERERADIMALKCNTCGHTFGLHHWGSHGPGPFDGLVCPTPEAQTRLAALDADRFGLLDAPSGEADQTGTSVGPDNGT